jgi:hypothetical protein
MNNVENRFIVDVYTRGAIVNGEAVLEWQFAKLAADYVEAEDLARKYETNGFAVRIETP